MKKSTYFLIITASLFLVGCGNNNNTEEKSTSKSSESEQTTSTHSKEKHSEVSSNSENKAEAQSNSTQNQAEEEPSVVVPATTPEQIRGTWSGTLEDGTALKETIDTNSILFLEKNYKITHFDQVGNTYTLYWDENDYQQNYGGVYNPQPFIYTYDATTNRLIIGGPVPMTNETNVDMLIYLNKE